MFLDKLTMHAPYNTQEVILANLNLIPVLIEVTRNYLSEIAVLEEKLMDAQGFDIRYPYLY